MWTPKPNPPPPIPPFQSQQRSPQLPSQQQQPSSWLASNERVSVDSVSNDVRLQAEKKLVMELMHLVQMTKNQLVQQCGGESKNLVLTHREQDVFSRYTYYGYQYGIMTGMTSFLVLYGGLRYAGYRRHLKEFYLPNVSEQYHQTLVSRRQQYNVFDNPRGNNKLRRPTNGGRANTSEPNAATTTTTRAPTTATKPSVSASNTDSPKVTLFTTAKHHSFALFPNDTSVTIQMYVSSAIALLISVLTWNYNFDWDKLHEDVSNLPLQSGPSLYCQVLCQTMLNRQDQIYTKDLHIPITIIEQVNEQSPPKTTAPVPNNANPNPEANATDNDSNSSDSAAASSDDDTSPTVRIVQLSVKELWEDPISENLHRMKRLLVHCEQRQQYEQECLKRDTRLVHPNERLKQILLADVPEPSLPLRYHSISRQSAPSPPSPSVSSSNNTFAIAKTK